jgi:hypothetical protein
MAKKADGFELKFTHRGSWMVERITGRYLGTVRTSGLYCRHKGANA